MNELTPAEARTQFAVKPSKKHKLHAIEDRTIQGRNGDIPIRIYRPSDQSDLPVIVFFHGGGWVVGSLDGHEPVCRRLARENGMVVVSVDYRLAPEHKYPAAAEDCYDATLWVWENSAELGINPNKIIIAGDSAGGNMAAVVALMARDLGKPNIAFQLLIYPVVDGTMSHPSIDANHDAPILTKAMMRWFVDHYQRQPSDVREAYFSPLLAADLSNLPPALVLTAEHDPLRDEGRAYAARLRQAGSMAHAIDYPRMVHGFLSLGNLASGAKFGFADIQSALQQFRVERPATSKSKLRPILLLAAVGLGGWWWRTAR